MSGTTLYNPFLSSTLAPIPPPAAAGGLPSDQPGLFCVSPATWANIASMGAGMVQAAERARTEPILPSAIIWMLLPKTGPR
jgi:hypothetical protein